MKFCFFVCELSFFTVLHLWQAMREVYNTIKSEALQFTFGVFPMRSFIALFVKEKGK